MQAKCTSVAGTNLNFKQKSSLSHPPLRHLLFSHHRYQALVVPKVPEVELAQDSHSGRLGRTKLLVVQLG